MKILLVDDHPLVRDAMQHVLAELGDDTTVVGAGDVPSALVLMEAHTDFDLVLLDLALPGPSGMAALEMVREHHPATPVVVLSGSDDPSTVLNALDRGAMGFIPKCSSAVIIVNAIRLVLSGGIYIPPQAVNHSAPPSRPDSAPELTLTERQTEVLALMVRGYPNKSICRALNLAEGTVKIHVAAILKALNVSNRTQAVIAASQLGLKLPTR